MRRSAASRAAVSSARRSSAASARDSAAARIASDSTWSGRISPVAGSRKRSSRPEAKRSRPRTSLRNSPEGDGAIGVRVPLRPRRQPSNAGPPSVRTRRGSKVQYPARPVPRKARAFFRCRCASCPPTAPRARSRVPCLPPSACTTASVRSAARTPRAHPGRLRPAGCPPPGTGTCRWTRRPRGRRSAPAGHPWRSSARRRGSPLRTWAWRR